ncbi:inositol oxygenase [Pochonia chlamydosporia 170]|uniref:Inositol oxygenase n=1 Tax=Pochonia chlamydosporia 170 TaxID=1380566 RepID=A0A179FFC7_METCM|nr:inositol oxygenase [Pochonia chlamydosporia 170]OAQ64107.1 inositol oxygenase [Pochonia chlamydosporia 170]
MAPSAIVEYPPAAHDAGQVLEDLSDAIDDVNCIKYDSETKFDTAKDKTQFRQYEEACDRVKNFYKEQHEKQTVAYNLAARNRFNSASRPRPEMTVWQAIEKLNTLVDESDPDTTLSQIEHLLQSAEAIRRDGKPRWMQLTGLIHDLGKLMLFFPELETQGQWDVVGDTFPVGCAFDKRIILPDTFAANPDTKDPVYSTKFGIYAPGCGLDNIMLSWGHDEYLYHVVKDQSTLPDEALAMIRYHSFYPWHREGAYRELMCKKDHDMLKAVQAFNPYDLYSKSDDVPSVEVLKPYYLDLIDEFFPQKVIKW